jgi:hypothetical protein
LLCFTSSNRSLPSRRLETENFLIDFNFFTFYFSLFFTFFDWFSSSIILKLQKSVTVVQDEEKTNKLKWIFWRANFDLIFKTNLFSFSPKTPCLWNQSREQCFPTSAPGTKSAPKTFIQCSQKYSTITNVFKIVLKN